MTGRSDHAANAARTRPVHCRSGTTGEVRTCRPLVTSSSFEARSVSSWPTQRSSRPTQREYFGDLDLQRARTLESRLGDCSTSATRRLCVAPRKVERAGKDVQVVFVSSTRGSDDEESPADRLENEDIVG